MGGKQEQSLIHPEKQGQGNTDKQLKSPYRNDTHKNAKTDGGRFDKIAFLGIKEQASPDIDPALFAEQ